MMHTIPDDLLTHIIAWSAWVICLALLLNALYQAFRGLRLWRTLGALLALLPLVVVEQIALAGRSARQRLSGRAANRRSPNAL